MRIILRRILGAIPVLLLPVALIHCGDDDPATGGTTAGVLRLSLTTTGTPIDPDGYGLRIDGATHGSVPVNGSTFYLVTPGSHSVTVEGIWIYCDVAGTTSGRKDSDFTVEINDTTEVQVAVSCQPALRNRIVFAGQLSRTYGMNAVRPDGSGIQLVATVANGALAFPDVSSDGTRIAVVTGGPSVTHLVVLNSEGDSLGIIATSLNCPTIPAWSPNHGRVAFSQCGGGPMYLIDSDGTDQAPVNNNRPAVSTMGWTPDGNHLVYGTSVGLESHLAISDLDGHNEVLLTTLANEQVLDPAVSPDGSRVVFSRGVQHPGSSTTADLYTININGTNEQPLVVSASYKSHPRWSPDGLSIVYAEDITSSLWVVPAAGGGPTLLVPPTPSPPSWPTWTW